MVTLAAPALFYGVLLREFRNDLVKTISHSGYFYCCITVTENCIYASLMGASG